MDVKQAVAAAKQHVAELFANEGVAELGLEEVDFDEAREEWLITVGFARRWDVAGVARILESVPRRTYKIVVIAISFLFSVGHALAQSAGAGPSFACPVPRDPLAQLICDNPALARYDLLFVQTYMALRQQLGDPGLQVGLRQEAIEFNRAVRISCGIATAQSPNSRLPFPPPAPSGAADCVRNGYQRQRYAWRYRLYGDGAEEADRTFDEQVQLQVALLRLNFLVSSEPPDGVFGTTTRTAIIAWQSAEG